MKNLRKTPIFRVSVRVVVVVVGRLWGREAAVVCVGQPAGALLMIALMSSQHLLFGLILLVVAVETCEPYCLMPCAELNSEMHKVCGGCKDMPYACRPGQPGFPADGEVVSMVALPPHSTCTSDPRAIHRKPPASFSERTAFIAQYYDRFTSCYSAGYGKIFQQYRSQRDDADEVRLLAAQAQFEDGMSLLDNGCGVGGVMEELLRLFPSAHIDGITNSGLQAEEAQARMRSLDCRACQVWHADMAAPLPDPMASHYDRILFLESLGYVDCASAAREAARALRPGGMVLVKDVCRAANSTDEEAQTFAEFAQYDFRTTLEIESCFEAAGFQKRRLHPGREDGGAGGGAPAQLSDRARNAAFEDIQRASLGNAFTRITERFVRPFVEHVHSCVLLFAPSLPELHRAEESSNPSSSPVCDTE
jgi:cyclopropane fatty-acyl-phospholipid synthase-like methyltransferase